MGFLFRQLDPFTLPTPHSIHPRPPAIYVSPFPAQHKPQGQLECCGEVRRLCTLLCQAVEAEIYENTIHSDYWWNGESIHLVFQLRGICTDEAEPKL